MSYELNNEDYLKLWMYFEDRADKVKEAMFKTITWTIGYAAALLAFIFLNLIKFEAGKAMLSHKWLVIASAAAGIVICLYSWFALHESGNHIERNWERAKQCEAKFKRLDSIITGKKKGEGFMHIWNQLLIIVALFAVAFTMVIILAVTADAAALPVNIPR